MPAYWWKCENCRTDYDFSQVTESRGVAHYIWDDLLPSSWDQNHLRRRCKACHKLSLRIAYDFPRKEKVTLFVVHMVGLGPYDGSYIPMMWETTQPSEGDNHWFDFKYVNGRSLYGLNKPAVFERDNLRELFSLYQNRARAGRFP